MSCDRIYRRFLQEKKEIHLLQEEIAELLGLNSTRTSNYEAMLQVLQNRAKRVLKIAAECPRDVTKRRNNTPLDL